MCGRYNEETDQVHFFKFLFVSQRTYFFFRNFDKACLIIMKIAINNIIVSIPIFEFYTFNYSFSPTGHCDNRG